jgi:SAM-dependent methyltransferase
VSADAPLRPTIIPSLAGSVPQALALLAGMELDLFPPLRDGPLTTDQISQALGVGAARLQPLLALLAATGLLMGEPDGRFTNSPEAAAFLVRGQPGYMGSVHELWADMWRAELRTARSVRSGKPQAAHNFAAMSADELHAFIRGSHSGAVSAARLLLAARDLSDCHQLLDVGGGSGGLAITMSAALPAIRATVVELPLVAPITQRFVDEASAHHTVKVAIADVARDPLPCRGDVAVCNRFVQVLAPDAAARAIAHIAEALEPGGIVYIMGQVLDDSRLSPPAAVAFGLLALNMYAGGQAFTEADHRGWLDGAGFVNIRREMLPNGYSLMSARKPG